MSRPVHERLRELEAEVRDLPVPPAAAVRARGRSRGRKQLAVAWAATAVAATAGIAFIRPHQANAPAADTGRVLIAPGLNCVLSLPDGPAEVQVRVLDGGAPAGTVQATVTDLRSRSFPARNGTTGPGLAGPTAVRYGPAAIGAATLLRAMVSGEVTMQFEPDRRGDVVDLTLGPDFRGLATTTEVNQKLVEIGEPSASPHCSSVASRPPGR